jgi:hypothetical protein
VLWLLHSQGLQQQQQAVVLNQLRCQLLHMLLTTPRMPHYTGH